jgi:hypothetical protein
MTRSLNPGLFVNYSPAVGTNAAIAMKRASARSPAQLGNNEGYSSSCAGVSGCFTRWPAAPADGSRSSGGEGQSREKPHRPVSDTGSGFDAWAGSVPPGDALIRQTETGHVVPLVQAMKVAAANAVRPPLIAGIEHAKAKEGAAYLGRKPSYTRKQFIMVKHMLGQDAVGIARIAKETGLTRQTVYRIKDDPAAVEAALAGL